VLLSDCDLLAEIRNGGLAIDPFDRQAVQPSSIDMRPSAAFLVFNNNAHTHIDPARPLALTTTVNATEEGFVLHPGELVLASTVERVSLGSALAARLEGKSSLGRLGLMVHSTAGFIDPGFSGHITLELSNVAKLPIILRPDMRIGQLCVFRLSSPADRPYGTPGLGSRYQGQRGPTESRSWWDYQQETKL